MNSDPDLKDIFDRMVDEIRVANGENPYKNRWCSADTRYVIVKNIITFHFENDCIGIGNPSRMFDMLKSDSIDQFANAVRDAGLIWPGDCSKKEQYRIIKNIIKVLGEQSPFNGLICAEYPTS